MSIGFYTLRRPKLALCIVFPRRGWKWQFKFDCNWRRLLEKKKTVWHSTAAGKCIHASAGKSSFHILVYAAAGCVMNRRSRSKITDGPPRLCLPLKKVPSASTWFTLKCTRVALGRAFSGTDGPAMCPLISPCPSWTRRNVNSRQLREPDSPAFQTMLSFYIRSIQFLIRSGCVPSFLTSSSSREVEATLSHELWDPAESLSLACVRVFFMYSRNGTVTKVCGLFSAGSQVKLDVRLMIWVRDVLQLNGEIIYIKKVIIPY